MPSRRHSARSAASPGASSSGARPAASTLVDDYAHLPGEIVQAIRAARESGWPRVVVAFQPHRYSRTGRLWREFADAFGGADQLDAHRRLRRGGGAGPRASRAASSSRPCSTPTPRSRSPTSRAGPSSPTGSRPTSARATSSSPSAPATSRRCPTSSSPGTPGEVRGDGGRDARRRARDARGLRVDARRVDRRPRHLPTRAVRSRRWSGSGPRPSSRRWPRSSPSSGRRCSWSGAARTCSSPTKASPGLVVVLDGEFDEVVVSERDRRPPAGAVALPVLARRSAAAGRAGLEFLVGIPGSVGGAVRMNAGGHGRETREVLRAGLGGRPRGRGPPVDAAGRPISPSATGTSDLGDTDIVRPGRARGRPPTTRRAARRGSPRSCGGAGSTSPAAPTRVGVPQPARTTPPAGSSTPCGLKGLRSGGATVSEKHANFIQADAGARAGDVRDLVLAGPAPGRGATGVRLVPELRLVGFGEPVVTVAPPRRPRPSSEPIDPRIRARRVAVTREQGQRRLRLILFVLAFLGAARPGLARGRVARARRRPHRGRRDAGRPRRRGRRAPRASTAATRSRSSTPAPCATGSRRCRGSRRRR